MKAKLIKFMIGLILLAGFYTLLASGATPPGIAGEVLRHNRTHNIDASPFWYGDVENMADYERGVRTLRERKAEQSGLRGNSDN